jgi:hypothetical protein
MKGLILKDIYVLLKQVKFLLLVVVLFAFMPGLSFSAFALVYCAMLPLTTIGYDERAKWDKYAATMPYSRADIVLSKYLLGYYMPFICNCSCSARKYGYAVFGDTPITSDTFISILSILCVALAFLSINLPVIFKWGIEKGRLIFIASIALFAGVIAMSAVFYRHAVRVRRIFK